LAGFGLALSAHSAGKATLIAFCGTGVAWILRAADLTDALQLVVALNPPARLLAEWALMLLAMMPPLLAVPLMHVWQSSLPRRRLPALAIFTLGYGCVWMMAGPVLMGLVLLLQLVGRDGTFACALLLATVWSASPWQRTAHNRSHRLSRIGLFGWAAYRDCFVFGATHAVWCTASCWAWMLVPLAAGHWHVPAMIFVGGIMLGERLAAPDRPRWHLPVFLFLLDRWPIFAPGRSAASHA
jgi:predicted metal-binding membrane protein